MAKIDLHLVDLGNNEIVRRKREFKEDFSPFSMIGVIRDMINKNRTPEDIFDILGTVSRSAYNFFLELKLQRNPVTNMCHYPTDTFTPSERVLARGYIRELVKVNVIVKAKTYDTSRPVKKYTYMLNPFMIKCKEYSRAQEVWGVLTKETGGDPGRDMDNGNATTGPGSV